MGIKDLFDKKNQLLSDKNLEGLGKETESPEYIQAYEKNKERYIPHIDYSTPSSFVKFGSAEKYYVDAIQRVYKTYPYDGSLKEKIEWELSSSYLDLYVFEKEYPRTNGHIILSTEPAGGWGALVASSGGYGAPASSSYEYIYIKGGPHTSKRTKGKDITDKTGDYKDGFANIYNFGKNRESNLKIDGLDGNTVEFWMKKREFIPTLTKKEVIFDAYTISDVSASTGYGRLRVEMSGHGAGSAAESPFYVTYMSGGGTSGGDGFANYQIGDSSITTTTVADSKWHHYAFTFANSGSNVQTKLYIDGVCNDEITVGSDISYVSGNIVATIGALAYAPSGSNEEIISKGWGKMSGSLDEFRFWKTKRSSQQIGRYYRDQIGGGTNTDPANTSLGVYYKFNEGITQTSSVDSVVLDYSGRLSNGTWVGYTSPESRHTGSAIVESSASATEFKDPILYPSHPDVSNYLAHKKQSGREYDYKNNSSIYYSIPSWVIEEDGEKPESHLRNLTQIIGSYFDTLAQQVSAIPKLQQKMYPSSSYKPYPFMDRVLDSVGMDISMELFSDVQALEYYRNRNDERVFKDKLYNIKNSIYTNIYNNILNIYKSKGTEKSFRNLMRCFGVDDELVKINLYANNATYELQDNYRSVGEAKNFINFFTTGSSVATVYQMTASTDFNDNTVSFISGSIGGQKGDVYDRTKEGAGLALTMETEVLFPVTAHRADVHTYVTGATEPTSDNPNLVTSSLFGMHTAESASQGDLQWDGKQDYANFQVRAIKFEEYSKRTKFSLTSSNPYFIPTLESDYFSDVYDDQKWNFAVSVRPSRYPQSNFVTSSTEGGVYTVEFYGVRAVLDQVKEEFLVTGTMTNNQGLKFVTSPKRIFVGAHRTDFTGTLLQSSDVKVGSTRLWMTHLPTASIGAHAFDVTNFGTQNPLRSAYLYQNSISNIHIPERDTLALHWDFSQITGSNTAGKFLVQDRSSGSADIVRRYGWLGNILGKQHTGRGDFFPAATPTLRKRAVSREYLYSAKKQLPEIFKSADTTHIIHSSSAVQTFNRELRPTDYYIAFEKSMYQTISEEMLKYFATVKDFNNLIGAPVNRYRPNYKHLEKLRQLFFERVDNTPDLDKYIEYYKWLDNALNSFLEQLMPASAKVSEGPIRNVVESHILERNKYWTKYPTIEDKGPQKIEGIAAGVGAMSYNWKHGHAPISTAENENCFWWKERTERGGTLLTSGDSNVDSNKRKILLGLTTNTSGAGPTLAKTASSGFTAYEGNTYALRRLSKPYKFKVDESKNLHGGVNFSKNKKVDFYKTVRNFNGSDNPAMYTFVRTTVVDPLGKGTDLEQVKNCQDDLYGLRENQVNKVGFKVTNNMDGSKTYVGDTIFPFNLISSSVTNNVLNKRFTNYGGVFKYDITNLHSDVYGPSYEIPMQGPFTEKYVGGNQHRHAEISPDGADSINTRPEAWRMTQGYYISISDPSRDDGPGNVAIGNFNAALPRAMYYRDEVAKRPINIRNIRQTTGSVLNGTNTRIGNYTKDYEIVQTSGRKINNRFFVKNEGVSASFHESAAVSGIFDFSLPDRIYSAPGENRSTVKNKFIFSERFSAPGGPEIMGRGFLDLESEEYAVYNAMPFRNLTVRLPMQEYFTNHTKQFGLYSDTQKSASWDRFEPGLYPGTSGTVNTYHYDTTASFHKIHRNTQRRVVYAHATASMQNNGQHLTKSFHDNWWVQHQIPRSDMQYSWITASSNDPVIGYEQPNYSNASLASTDIGFVTQGDPENQYGIKADIAGLNLVVVDPIDSDNNTLINTDSFYGNEAIGAVDGTQELNALILHRQGPHGWPTWRQIRGGNHSIIRYHKKNNTISFLKTVLYKLYKKAGSGGTELRTIHKITSAIEPPVTSKYHPMVHELGIKRYVSQFEQAPTQLTLKHTYANNLAYFTQPTDTFNNLNNVGGIKRINPGKKKQLYDSINKMMFSDAMGVKSNPIDRLDSVVYTETIFPREKYTYLNRIRSREEFKNNFWRDSQDARIRLNAKNTSDETIAKQSIWALDARIEFETTASQHAGQGGEGELMNNYCQFHDGTPANIKPGALYARRIEEKLVPDAAAAAPRDYPVVYGGDTKWEAGTQAGKNPFYQNYDEYVEEMRRVGRDYGLLPEFRISEHMSYYIDKKGANFLSDAPGFLTLTGSRVGISSSTNPEFFRVYSHTDFMRFFDVVRDDYHDVAAPTELTLKCKAAMKFLPYDGFYPAQRTVEMVKLFSQSYGSNIEYFGSQQSYRTALAPLFAPGLLFNTIKSGLAVDYPIHTASFEVTGAYKGLHHAGHHTSSAGYPTQIPSVNGAYHYRVPFETLLNPENSLGDKLIVDGEVHPSASLDCSASLKNATSETYRLAMHNFLAEVPEFFLQDGTFTTFASKPDSEFLSAEKDKDYRMRVVLYNGKYRSWKEVTDIATSYQDNQVQKYWQFVASSSYEWNPPSVKMYARTGSVNEWGSSFGPPTFDSAWSLETVIRILSTGDPTKTPKQRFWSSASYNPFTPPYYDGYAHAEIGFRATESKKYTLSEILANLNVDYKRVTTRPQDANNLLTVFGDDHQHSGERGNDNEGISQQNKMNLSASLNIFQHTNLRLVDTDAKGRPTTIKEDPNAPSQWVIQPKFETPVLDFSEVEVTLPAEGSGSVARGMWHQYGEIPTGSGKGIFLEIQDLRRDERENPNLTGSLIDLVGFSRSPQRLGTVANSKTISEAVIAIPFYYDDKNVQRRFYIDRTVIERAEDMVDGLDAGAEGPAPSVVDMVRKMRKYVIPPKLDFLTYRPTKTTKNAIHEQIEGGPFAMYIFEFSAQLTQQDLADIWQNLPPSIGRRIEVQEASIPHSIFGASIPGDAGGNTNSELLAFLPENIQWMVFKVKQKANFNYYAKTAASKDDARFKFNFQIGARGAEQGSEPDYSYNWPYDFFSLIELVKLDATVDFNATAISSDILLKAGKALSKTIKAVIPYTLPYTSFSGISTPAFKYGKILDTEYWKEKAAAKKKKKKKSEKEKAKAAWWKALGMDKDD